MDAKVDIQKLQLLNERINQTIDALNQVRLSVHGLSHTDVPMQAAGFAPTMPVFQPNYGLVPGVKPYWATGMQHTTPVGVPYLPYGVAPTPDIMGFPGGISHTSPDWIDPRNIDVRFLDPNRLAQAFPYAFVPAGPKVIW